VADGCILRITGSITEDAKTGTLEQVYLSPFSPSLTVLARSLAVLLYHSLRGLLLAAILMLLLRIPPVYSPGLALVFAITQIGAIGVAYAIAGFHLVTKNVSAITLAVSSALLFLTGAVTPLHNAPWLYALSRALPLTIGIELLREMLAGNMSLLTLLGQANLYWLLLNSAFYGLVGWAVLGWGQRTARQRGSLAHY